MSISSQRSQSGEQHEGPASQAPADGGAVSKGPPRLTKLREMQLLEAHRSGDPGALNELMASYQRRIYGLCYRMVHHEEDARDLAQDSLLKVIDALDRYDGRAALSTWIIRITINTCLDHLRQKKTRRQRSLEQRIDANDEESARTGPFPAALVTNEEHSGPRHVERRETQQTVLRALHELEPDARAILILRDVQELEYQQISIVLDMPVGTVKSRLYRAREALRQHVERLRNEQARQSRPNQGAPPRKTGTDAS